MVAAKLSSSLDTSGIRELRKIHRKVLEGALEQTCALERTLSTYKQNTQQKTQNATKPLTSSRRAPAEIGNAIVTKHTRFSSLCGGLVWKHWTSGSMYHAHPEHVRSDLRNRTFGAPKSQLNPNNKARTEQFYGVAGPLNDLGLHKSTAHTKLHNRSACKAWSGLSIRHDATLKSLNVQGAYNNIRLVL